MRLHTFLTCNLLSIQLHSSMFHTSLAFSSWRISKLSRPRLQRCHCCYSNKDQVSELFESPLNLFEVPRHYVDRIDQKPRTESKCTENRLCPTKGQRKKKKRSRFSTHVPWFILGMTALFPFTSAATDFTPHVAEQVSALLSTIAKQASDPQNLELQALTDTSHLMLDVSSFLTTEKIFLRLASIIGRILNIQIDVTVSPTHATPSPPEELIFQAAMMGMSMALFGRTAFPLIMSSVFATPLPFRDLVVYNNLFYPVGVSWIQFRTMLSMSVLDWIEIAPNTTVPTGLSDTQRDLMDQHIYWLYNGDTQVILQRPNTVLQYSLRRRRGKSVAIPLNETSPEAADPQRENHPAVNKTTRSYEMEVYDTDVSNDVGLIADMNFFDLLETGDKKKFRTSKKDIRDDYVPSRPMPIIQSGSKGALLLRIDAKKLVKLMDDDDKLDLSIRTLLLQGTQSNLIALLNVK